jgi:hypothetical protein
MSSLIKQEENQTALSLRKTSPEPKMALVVKKTSSRKNTSSVCECKCPPIQLAQQDNPTPSWLTNHQNLAVFFVIFIIFYWCYRHYQPKKYKAKSYQNGFYTLPTTINIGKTKHTV